MKLFSGEVLRCCSRAVLQSERGKTVVGWRFEVGGKAKVEAESSE